MPVPMIGAQRAPSRRSGPVRAAFFALAAMLALGTMAVQPAPASAASAAGVKVVIVVGPVESSTSRYISIAKGYAAQARSYGADVVEIYSPNATWPAVRNAAQGANLLIYLGHGNGHPSPYGAFSAYRKDGMGLNAAAGKGHSNVKYWGEYYIRTSVRLAPNAVVILNHLCYASGNSEPGRANPTRTVAKQRVDNFAAGFLRANARAVFAIGKGSASYTIQSLLTTNRTIGFIFQHDPSHDLRRDFSFWSSRTRGYQAWLDPYAANRYYRSVVGRLKMYASTVRGG